MLLDSEMAQGNTELRVRIIQRPGHPAVGREQPCYVFRPSQEGSDRPYIEIFDEDAEIGGSGYGALIGIEADVS
jgi:hypothetical protein